MKKRKLKSKLGLQEAFIRERLNKFSNVQSEPDNSIAEVFQTGDRNEILAALYYVAEKQDRSYLSEVMSFFRDRDPDVQGVAISTAGWLELGSNAHKMIDLLCDPVLYRAAWSTLVRPRCCIRPGASTIGCPPVTIVGDSPMWAGKRRAPGVGAAPGGQTGTVKASRDAASDTHPRNVRPGPARVRHNGARTSSRRRARMPGGPHSCARHRPAASEQGSAGRARRRPGGLPGHGA